MLEIIDHLGTMRRDSFDGNCEAEVNMKKRMDDFDGVMADLHVRQERYERFFGDRIDETIECFDEKTKNIVTMLFTMWWKDEFESQIETFRTELSDIKKHQSYELNSFREFTSGMFSHHGESIKTCKEGMKTQERITIHILERISDNQSHIEDLEKLHRNEDEKLECTEKGIERELCPAGKHAYSLVTCSSSTHRIFCTKCGDVGLIE